jgi:hypothetical protein
MHFGKNKLNCRYALIRKVKCDTIHMHFGNNFKICRNIWRVMNNIKLDDQLYEKIIKDRTYNRLDFFYLVNEINPKIPLSSVSWIIYRLIKLGKLQRIGRNKYLKGSSLHSKKEFAYQLGEYASILENDISNEFSSISFTIFETSILNEFVNHIRSENIIFVNVENGYMETIFDFLQDRLNSNIYLKPNIKILRNYIKNDMVIVSNLGSEYPKNRIKPTHCSTESFIVDIYRNKIISFLYSDYEINEIISEVITKYQLDFDKMYRYARRRNIADKLKKAIDKVHLGEIYD